MASNTSSYIDKGLKKGELLNDRFEIIGEIGQGAFGSVYSAYDKQNKRKK